MKAFNVRSSVCFYNCASNRLFSKLGFLCGDSYIAILVYIGLLSRSDQAELGLHRVTDGHDAIVLTDVKFRIVLFIYKEMCRISQPGANADMSHEELILLAYILSPLRILEIGCNQSVFVCFVTESRRKPC